MSETGGAPSRRRGLRSIVRATLLVMVIYLALEAFVPVRVQPSAYVLAAAIRAYQAVASPLVGKVVHCKFRPTCSHYALASVQKHGTIFGSMKTLGRLWRCSPWGPPPGEDNP